MWNNAVPINKTINAFPPIHKTFKHHSIRTRCVFATLWLRFAFRNDTPCNHVSRWHSHSHSRTIHCFLMMVLFLSFVCRISHLIVATINKSQMFYCRFVYFHSIYLMLCAIKEVKISFVCATKQIVYMWRLCVYCVWVHCSVHIYISSISKHSSISSLFEPNAYTIHPCEFSVQSVRVLLIFDLAGVATVWHFPGNYSVRHYDDWHTFCTLLF